MLLIISWLCIVAFYNDVSCPSLLCRLTCLYIFGDLMHIAREFHINLLITLISWIHPMDIVAIMLYVTDAHASILNLTFLDLSASTIHLVLYLSSFIQFNVFHSPIFLYKSTPKVYLAMHVIWKSSTTALWFP